MIRFAFQACSVVARYGPATQPERMMMKTDIQQIEVNGVSYVRADSVSTPQPNGKRAVVVVDRGWIFAGDVTEENGRIKPVPCTFSVGRALASLGWSLTQKKAKPTSAPWRM